MEMYSVKNYACFNRGFRHDQAVNRTNFVGFSGGKVATGPKRACA